MTKCATCSKSIVRMDQQHSGDKTDGKQPYKHEHGQENHIAKESEKQTRKHRNILGL